MRIGIDIGNVIIGGGGDDTQFFGDDFLGTPEVDGAVASIRRLAEAGNEIFLISKCGPKVQAKTMQYFRFYEVLQRAGIKEFPYFVESRKDKWPVARALKLDLFIDDREDIIVSMHRLQYAILFKSWKETMQELEDLGIV